MRTRGYRPAKSNLAPYAPFSTKIIPECKPPSSTYFCEFCNRPGSGARLRPSLRHALAPPELDALALGDEEQVVPQRVQVLVVDGDEAEAAVAVGPDERRQVPRDPVPRAEAPRRRAAPAPGRPGPARCSTPPRSAPQSSPAGFPRGSWCPPGPGRKPFCGPRPQPGTRSRPPAAAAPERSRRLSVTLTPSGG